MPVPSLTPTLAELLKRTPNTNSPEATGTDFATVENYSSVPDTYSSDGLTSRARVGIVLCAFGTLCFGITMRLLARRRHKRSLRMAAQARAEERLSPYSASVPDVPPPYPAHTVDDKSASPPFPI